jgi:hypothetical protein
MDASADFKPSQVYLSSGPPLGATMRKTEREAAAAYLVRVCHDHGDVWQPITDEMFKKTVRADVAAVRDPVASWIQNPFLRPDMGGLVADGFARYGQDGQGPIEFTQAGLNALKPYVRRPTSVPQSA